MASPVTAADLVYSIWTNATLAEWEASGCKKVHSAQRVKKYGKGTLLVCVNSDTKTIFGVAILGGPFERMHLLDPAVYLDAAAAKYNHYEAPLSAFHKLPTPVSFADVNRVCGIVDGKGSYNSYTKHVWANYVKLRYTPPKDGTPAPEEHVVAARFHDLVLSWLADPI